LVARSVAELLGAGVQPGSMVNASGREGPTAGWLVVEDDDAAGGGERRCAVVGIYEESVLEAGPVSEVMVAGWPMPMADAMPRWVPALAGAMWAA
jgi:hypothetical protein